MAHHKRCDFCEAPVPELTNVKIGQLTNPIHICILCAGTVPIKVLTGEEPQPREIMRTLLYIGNRIINRLDKISQKNRDPDDPVLSIFEHLLGMANGSKEDDKSISGSDETPSSGDAEENTEPA